MRLSEVGKSYVNGVWTPITKVPKKALKRSVRQGRFGQKHLKDVSDAKTSGLRVMLGAQMNARAKDKLTGKTVRNIYNKRKMDVISEGAMPGPHVNWRATPSQRHHYRPANKKSLREVGLTGHANVGGFARDVQGVKISSGRAAITAHEHAHGTRSRPIASRLAAMVNRENERQPKRISRIVAAQKPDAPKRLQDKLGPETFKYQQKALRGAALTNLGEEARADVMASRKLGRRMVSGHVTDTGDPKDYLRRRNRIERGMKQPRTRMRDVMRQTEGF